jgi:hypothetical protein
VTVRRRVGLAVVFAALGADERRAIVTAWRAAVSAATSWRPAFEVHGTDPLEDAAARRADLLVYLGESSRFGPVAAEFAAQRPVVLVKSTVEQLLVRPTGAPPRWRVCAGVDGIARLLAGRAPHCPTVDWTTLPWPSALGDAIRLEPTEQGYVNTSLGAFREAAGRRGIAWRAGLPAKQQPFTVFLTMHDPLAARLAAAALERWPQCTVLTADGMVSDRAPDGSPWPARLWRLRHWSPRSRSRANELFRRAIGRRALPDFDTAGLLFGTLAWMDCAFATGVPPDALDSAEAGPGPLGPLRFNADGTPHPARLIAGPTGNLVSLRC